MDLVFKIAYLAAMILEVVIRLPYDRQRRGEEKEERRITGVEYAVLGGLSVGMFLVPLIYALTSLLDFADYPWPADLKLWGGIAGLAFMAATLWLFARAHHDLGAYWSPSLEIGMRHRLIIHGVYARVRHPMYSSQLLWSMAQVLLLQNWIAGLSGFLTFLLLYYIRLPREEEMMLDHFGDAYRDYCRRTGRIIPRLR